MSELDDLPPPSPLDDLPPPTANTWASAAKGVGESALGLASGTGRAVVGAVNDLLPEWIGGAGSREAIAQKIASSPILNYKPGPEAQPIQNVLGAIAAPIQKVGGAIHQGISDATSPRIADIVGDVATLAPFGMRELGDLRGALGERAAAIEEGHPLSAAAQEESGRLSNIQSAAESRGYDLPEGGTPQRHAEASINNRPLVNADARTELNLPKNAPLTPQMLQKARAANAGPGYQAIQNLPEPIPLNRAALDDARTANMNGTPSERLPFPAGDSISGAEAVDFSKKARYLANQLEKNPANPFASQDAQMYRDAAEAVEDSVRSHLTATERGGMADAWDNARVYTAKSYSVEGALDGAGNVRASDLKSQLFSKKKPLSGSLEDIANLAAQYPEAFKTTRVTAPQPGPVRRAAAYLAPVATAGLGGYVGGTPGAAIGAAAGEHAASKILNQ